MPLSGISDCYPAGIKSYQKTVAMAATAVRSPRCHLENHTDTIRLRPILRLRVSSVRVLHITTQAKLSSEASRYYNLQCDVKMQISSFDTADLTLFSCGVSSFPFT